ncbi:MAG: type II secretion system protein [Deltaproteobacteria bacterium]|nr:type II secretion system protein [Deltaproteobacteria bacterium]
MSSKDLCKGGFILLEVMISLAIAAGLLVTLIYTLNYHLGLAERQLTITTAVTLAKEKLYEAVKKPGEGSGIFPEPYAAYAFETAVKDSKFSGMMEIAVKVRSGKEEVTLSRLVTAPLGSKTRQVQ